MEKIINRKGYTLAEVVIVMLIIAVVVSISIRAAKTKMDNIITYNYYAAYETMRNVTKDLLLDYDAADDDYTAYIFNTKNLSFWNKIKYSNAVWAIEKPVDQTSDIECKLNGYSGSDGKNCYMNVTDQPGGGGMQTVIPNENDKNDNHSSDSIDEGGIQKPTESNPCAEHYKQDGSYHWDNNLKKCVKDDDTEPDGTDPDGTDPNGTDPDVTGGSGDDGDGTGGSTGGSTDPDGTGGSTGGSTDPDGTGGSTGGSTDPDGTGEGCTEGFHWDSEESACVPDGRTIPKKDFCPNFEGKVNTKALVSSDSISEYCKGDSISDSDTDFSTKNPDLILRNGMRLYNLSQPYVEIEALKDGAAGAIFLDLAGNEIDTNKNGYIVYADIDGLKGESKLWVDVFPFYITLSGQVIPAYPADGSAAGGNDKFYLSTSLSYEKIDGSKRKTYWLTKSVSYQESACKSGYIDENTDYCGTIKKENACKEENIDCRIKYIKPSPFFK